MVIKRQKTKIKKLKHVLNICHSDYHLKRLYPEQFYLLQWSFLSKLLSFRDIFNLIVERRQIYYMQNRNTVFLKHAEEYSKVKIR